MSQKTLAKTDTPGVSELTLARLDNAGLDNPEAQQRFLDIVTYAGVTPDDILPYVEAGDSLQTIGAAVEARKDSTIANESSLGQVVRLARSIGDMTGEGQGLPKGMTIFNGRLVTQKEMTELELAELQQEATAAGLDPTKSTEQAEMALPGSGKTSTTAAPVTTKVEAPASESDARISEHSSQTAQQQVMNALLETAEEALGDVEGIDAVETLFKFITAEYDGDGIRAFVEMNRDEAAFNRALAGSVQQHSADLLLVADEMSDDETGARNKLEILSLELSAEDEGEEED